MVSKFNSRRFFLLFFCLIFFESPLALAWWSTGLDGLGPGPNGTWPSAAQACESSTQFHNSGEPNCIFTGVIHPFPYKENWRGCENICTYKGGQSDVHPYRVQISETMHLCPPPFVMNASENICEAKCETNKAWDPIALRCVDQKYKSCKDITGNPINIERGEKYRTEEIIATGVSAPIRLVYFYNNRKNNQPVGSTIIYNANTPTYIAATKPPISEGEYKEKFTTQFVEKTTDAAQNQYRAGWYRSWRHNYEEALQFDSNSRITWLRSDGEDIVFSASGDSQGYGNFHLSPLTVSEFGFAGYRVQIVEEQKIFDAMGRLRRWIFKDGSYHDIQYAVNGVDILKIINSRGSELNFIYALYDESVISLPNKIESNYPVSVTDATGNAVSLSWSKNYTGVLRKYYLLTRYTHPARGAGLTAREFAYNDTRWPGSITEIYDVTNIATNSRKLYAHFEYDDQGRATYSGLAGGVDAVKVNYVDNLTRVITNALGKQSTYSYADFNGVRRLKSVTGEPTATCVKSATQYEYDGAGNIQNEIANGTTLHREYDGLGREILRTQAFGTPDASTTQTCWHSTLNQPSRLIEPSKVTLYDYWPNGQIKSQTTKPRPAGAVDCVTAL